MDPSNPRQVPWAYAMLLISPLFMASNVVIGRAAHAAVPPVGLAFWRWVIAFLILLPFAWSGLRRHGPALRAAWPAVMLLGALGMGICGAFVYVGLQRTTATNAGLIYAATPILILLIAAVSGGERVTARQGLGVALALSGVVTVLTRGHPEALLRLDVNGGDLWIVAATVSWAVYSVLIRRAGLTVPTIPLFAAVAAAGVVCLAPFYLWETLAGAPVVPTPEAVLSIAGVALFASVLAFSTYQKGIAVLGASRAGPFMYLMPLYGAGLAVLLLGERFEPFHAAGLALIVPGVAFATLARPRAAQSGESGGPAAGTAAGRPGPGDRPDRGRPD